MVYSLLVLERWVLPSFFFWYGTSKLKQTIGVAAYRFLLRWKRVSIEERRRVYVIGYNGVTFSSIIPTTKNRRSWPVKGTLKAYLKTQRRVAWMGRAFTDCFLSLTTTKKEITIFYIEINIKNPKKYIPKLWIHFKE